MEGVSFYYIQFANAQCKNCLANEVIRGPCTVTSFPDFIVYVRSMYIAGCGLVRWLANVSPCLSYTAVQCFIRRRPDVSLLTGVTSRPSVAAPFYTNAPAHALSVRSIQWPHPEGIVSAPKHEPAVPATPCDVSPLKRQTPKISDNLPAVDTAIRHAVDQLTAFPPLHRYPPCRRIRECCSPRSP